MKKMSGVSRGSRNKKTKTMNGVRHGSRTKSKKDD